MTAGRGQQVARRRGTGGSKAGRSERKKGAGVGGAFCFSRSGGRGLTPRSTPARTTRTDRYAGTSQPTDALSRVTGPFAAPEKVPDTVPFSQERIEESRELSLDRFGRNVILVYEI